MIQTINGTVLWSGFIGVVTGGVITAAGTWLAAWFAARRSAKDSCLERRAKAYAEFLACCGLIGLTAESVRTVLTARTGLTEGLMNITGSRRPLTPEQVIELFRRDLDPLYRAWSSVWASGSQAAITLSNEVMEVCADLLQISSSGDNHQPIAQKTISGVSFGASRLEEISVLGKKLASSRRKFAAIAREETGQAVALLFSE